MRKSRKDQLFKAAFELFLTHHFDSVSIADIEKTSGMTRGAIFYYASSKEELFKAVIRYFILDKQDIDHRTLIKEYDSLKEFILNYVEGANAMINSMKNIIDDLAPGNASRAYLSLALQACSYYKDFTESLIEQHNNEICKWVAILHKAIELEEIRADIDVMKTARHFRYIFLGLSYSESLSTGLQIKDLEEQLFNLYDLLKK